MQIQSMEEQYLQIMSDILDNGVRQGDRTGTGTLELWGPTLRCHVGNAFPLLTSKKVFHDKVFSELCWMVRGETNVKLLHKWGNHIWDDWADESGELGPVYGAQWRSWGGSRTGIKGADGVELRKKGIDQLSAAVERIKTNPTCRRIIVTAWNPTDVPEMRLPPCHLYYQFNVQHDQLNMMAVMRSADWFIGVPFNIAQYAALLHLVAKLTGLRPGILQMQFGSAHLYLNHLDQAREQLERGPVYGSRPTLSVGEVTILDDVYPEHFTVSGYEHREFIKAPISV